MLLSQITKPLRNYCTVSCTAENTAPSQMLYALPFIREARSSMVLSLIPLPFGSEIHALPESEEGPMTITLLIRVQKLLPLASFTWMISYDPGCFSRVVITPTRPVLFPLLIMHIAPTSNLHLFSIFPVSKFTRTVSRSFCWVFRYARTQRFMPRHFSSIGLF